MAEYSNLPRAHARESRRPVLKGAQCKHCQYCLLALPHTCAAAARCSSDDAPAMSGAEQNVWTRVLRDERTQGSPRSPRARELRRSITSSSSSSITFTRRTSQLPLGPPSVGSRTVATDAAPTSSVRLSQKTRGLCTISSAPPARRTRLSRL